MSALPDGLLVLVIVALLGVRIVGAWPTARSAQLHRAIGVGVSPVPPVLVGSAVTGWRPGRAGS